MKITARFYSVDDAEFAAAAIRRNGSDIFDITINERSTGAGRDGTFAPMGFFSGIGSGSTAAMPLPVYGAISDIEQPDGNHHESKSASIEIICRASEAKRVSSAIVSHGGHDIKGN